MLDYFAPETIMVINLYWKTVMLAGCLAALIAKLINWKRQTIKSYSSLTFLVIVLMILTTSIGFGMLRPALLAYPHDLLNNVAYSIFLMWFAATKCWATYRGSMVARTRSLPLPMVFK